MAIVGTSGRGRGWVRDSPDARDYGIYRLAASLKARWDLPSSCEDMCALVPSVRDQRSTSMCVGFTIARLLDVRARVLKTPLQVYPSAQGIYSAARARSAAGPTVPLEDTGCAPRDAAQSLTEIGWCGEDVIPFDPAAVNDRMTWSEFRDASDVRMTGYYKITSDGEERWDDLRRALSQGFPVGIGVEVDTAFENWGGSGVLDTPAVSTLGGHMLPILGYDGETVTGPNSWGTSWGAQGWFRASKAWVLDSRAGDLIVVDVGAAK